MSDDEFAEVHAAIVTALENMSDAPPEEVADRVLHAIWLTSVIVPISRYRMDQELREGVLDLADLVQGMR